MPSKKAFSKVDQVVYNGVFLIAKIACEFKAIGGFGRFYAVLGFDMKIARGVGVILALRAVANDKNLHKLKKRVSAKKALPPVAVDLIESFFKAHAAAF